jgi:hypothetical protein
MATLVNNLTTAPRVEFGWYCLQDCWKTAPEYFYFDIAELDEIAAGKNWKKHREALYDGTYLEDVLPHIAWWIEVARALSHGRSREIDWDSIDPERVEFRKTVPLMVNDVLSCYAAALASVPDFAGSQRDPDKIEGLKMFKRYRRFTTYVRDFAHTIWSDRNLNWLCGQP